MIDSQSVKTTAIAGLRGYDGAKKFVGRKRHLIVDTLGLIWSVAVTPADTSEDDGACLVVCDAHERAPRMKTIYADSAYKRNGLPKWIDTTLRDNNLNLLTYLATISVIQKCKTGTKN